MARKVAATIEARDVDGLPEGKGWQYESKWDVFRCLARRDDDEVELPGRSGKSPARYSPRMISALSCLNRRAALERFFATLGNAGTLRLSPKTTRLAEARCG